MKSDNDLPKVSCLLVTADRLPFCERAIRCYRNQTYPNKELVVVDDGRDDLSPLLAQLPAGDVVYVKLAKNEANVLGTLRNIALETARGDYIAQWDDDDWYHPDRLQHQVEVLNKGYDACALSGALMHLDTEMFLSHPYIGILKSGIPGSIMHRRNNCIRYQELRRAEDTHYLKAWNKKRYIKLPLSETHLFIRCFHGNNTWDKSHFMTRMRNTPRDLIAYFWHRYIKQDLFGHNRFTLGKEAQASFEAYLADSYELNLLHSKVS